MKVTGATAAGDTPSNPLAAVALGLSSTPLLQGAMTSMPIMMFKVSAGDSEYSYVNTPTTQPFNITNPPFPIRYFKLQQKVGEETNAHKNQAVLNQFHVVYTKEELNALLKDGKARKYVIKADGTLIVFDPEPVNVGGRMQKVNHAMATAIVPDGPGKVKVDGKVGGDVLAAGFIRLNGDKLEMDLNSQHYGLLSGNISNAERLDAIQNIVNLLSYMPGKGFTGWLIQNEGKIK